MTCGGKKFALTRNKIGEITKGPLEISLLYTLISFPILFVAPLSPSQIYYINIVFSVPLFSWVYEQFLY